MNRRFLVFSVLATALTSAATAESALQGVAPGARDAFAPASPCPVFIWSLDPTADAYELLVYAADPSVAPRQTEPLLRVPLPAGVGSWTPPADRCLEPGRRYAWTVGTDGAGEVTSGSWSEPLLLEIVLAPTAAELQQALEVVRRYLGTDRVGDQMLGEATADILPTRAVTATESPRALDRGSETHDVLVGGGPATAVRGEVPGAAGETYGVRGVSNSLAGAGVRADNNAGGSDLRLGGSPVAELTEAGLSRDSASNLTFNFSNPGAGTMTLQVDGQGVVTSGTDDWVNETGDTMTGTLNLSPGAGSQALVTTAGDLALHTTATVTKGGSRFLWDDGFSFSAGRSALAINTGGSNTAVGTSALGANTVGIFNTAVGAFALDANTSASNNTAMGRDALGANTTGLQNTAVGAFALDANTTASNNTALGNGALGANTTGASNTAVGAFALDASTGASFNTAVGHHALGANTTGVRNTATGYRALAANIGGLFNTAMGAAALEDNTSGSSNTATGYRALQYNTTGFNNTAVGISALVSNTDGVRNAALGAYALLLNAGADDGTAVGYNALLFNTTGSRNTAVGQEALRDNTTGYENVAVGQRALVNNTTGHDNIAIGRYAGLNLDTGSENIHIGHQGVAGESNRIRIGTTGDQNQTFIAGIHGVAVTGAPVVISSSGQLGAPPCGSYLAVVSPDFCPFGVFGCGTGPTCDRVPLGALCESDGECGLDNDLNNCGCFFPEQDSGDWYLRID